jgi:hypothetical protein
MTTYTRTDLEKMFDEHLDSTIDPFGWEPHFWNASRVLKAVALPIYTEMFWNWFHGEEFVELPAPQDSPDVELYARQTDLEDEDRVSAMAMAEEHDDYHADRGYDTWETETFGEY